MRRLLAPAAGVAVLCLVLAGCTGGEDGPSFTVPAIGPADVDVDTPALREAKAAAGVEDCPEVDGPAVEGGFPEMTLACFGGGPAVDLAALRGPMVVNLWAQWCTPCRNEMPELEEFHQRYGDEVPVLGIDYQDPQAGDAMDFLASTGATYPQLADPGASMDTVEGVPRRRLPTMILLDETGRIAHAQPVEIESPEQLADLVREHLGVDL